MTDEELLEKSPLSGELHGKVLAVPGNEILTANAFIETRAKIPGLTFEYFNHGTTVEYHAWSDDQVFAQPLVEKMQAVLLAQDEFSVVDFWHVGDVCRTYEDSQNGVQQESVGFIVSFKVMTPMSYDLVVRCILDLFRG